MGVIILDEFDKTRYCGNLVLSGKVSHINGVIELLVGIKRPDTEAGTVDIVHVRDKSDTESLFDQGGNAVFIGRLTDNGWTKVVAAEKVLSRLTKS